MGRGKKRMEVTSSPPKPSSVSPKKPKKSTPEVGDLSFIGAPVPSDEAKSRWPHRYQSKVQLFKKTIMKTEALFLC